jgi:eukaryotic-like serine/threonine-protein kinase
MAYATLGVSYVNIGENKLGIESVKSANAVKDRATEKERFYIEAHMQDQVNGNFEKAREVYEQWLKVYPRDTIPMDNMAVGYSTTGDYEKMLAVTITARQLNPTDTFAYMWNAMAYMALGRFDEARAVAEEADTKKIDGLLIHILEYQLAYMKSDTAGMQKALDKVKSTGDEPILMMAKASGEAAQGRAKAAVASYEEARAMALSRGMKGYGALLQAIGGTQQANLGNCAEAKLLINESLAELPDGRNRGFASIGLAKCGDAATAQKLIDADLKDNPENTIQKQFYPLVQALNLLQKGNGAAAVAALEPARVHEKVGVNGGLPTYWMLYLRGLAYLQMKDADKALNEFKTILDHPGWGPTSELRPLAQLGVARAYVVKGDVAKAKTAYQDFLGMWKDADGDVPVLVEAKKEYGKLG